MIHCVASEIPIGHITSFAVKSPNSKANNVSGKTKLGAIVPIIANFLLNCQG